MPNQSASTEDADAQPAAESTAKPADDAADGRAAPEVVHVRPDAGAPRREGQPDTLLRCLVRVTQHFGQPADEADVRAAVPIPTGGMTPATFRRATERLGYRVAQEALSAENIALLPTPFVLTGGAGQPAAVVLDRSGDNLVLFDPLQRQNVTAPQGTALSIADTAILIRPAADDEKAARGWQSLIGNKVRSVLWELVLASLLINLFALASPLFLMTVYNKVIGQRALDTLTVLVIGMLMMYGFDAVLRAVRGYVSSHTGARTDALIGSEVVHHLVHLPYRHFESTPSGLISERLRQLDVIRNFFTGQMPITLVDICFVGVFVAALFFLHPILGGVVLAALPVFALISVAFHRAQKRLVEQNFMALAAKASALNETVSNALTIKSLGLESEVEGRWGKRLALGAWTSFQSHNLANIINVAGALLQQLTALGVIFLGVHLILAGELSIGALIAANILATRTLAPVRQVASAWSQLQEVRSAFDRLDDIMDEAVEQEPGTTSPMPALVGDIRVDAATFRFDPDVPPALDNVSLDVGRGTMVGVIGPTGSGKSTLIKLIQGLYVPDRGRVLIDGTDIRHVSPATLREQVGVVPQETQLFAGTVRENIAFGLPVKDPARVIQVAKFVGAHPFIQRLAQGYDTVLGERGSGLSAGQRQLLCIARALIRNPRIIIFDEGTSALDPAAEELLLRNLRQFARDRTVLMVSHRMAPMRICDKLVLLVDGRVERAGPAQEVLDAVRRPARGPDATPDATPDGTDNA